MRQRMTFILATGLLLSMATAESRIAGASSQRPPCDKIRAAAASGRTLDQIIEEFDTDAEQVTKCLQTRRRQRKSTAAPKQPRTKTKKKSSRTSPELKQPGREPREERTAPATPPRSRRPRSHPFGSPAAP